MFCQKCGIENADSSSFCSSCGSQLGIRSAVNSNNISANTSKEISGIGWYFEAVKKYAVFNGRARRKEYWMFALFFLIFIIVAAIIDVALGTTTEDGAGILVTIYILAMILPSLSVSVRRLHDLGKSGWFYLINFIPFIGAIWFLVLMCTEGNRGNNNFGADPKAAGN